MKSFRYLATGEYQQQPYHLKSHHDAQLQQQIVTLDFAMNFVILWIRSMKHVSNARVSRRQHQMIDFLCECLSVLFNKFHAHTHIRTYTIYFCDSSVIAIQRIGTRMALEMFSHC